ncbi:hypothetical protein [Candidatus Binatus sp.]|uniref:hypothetical protein n=1 Tax=Candidatus Binatus sp. TaxID=2811406 RepID=UPI003CA82965
MKSSSAPAPLTARQAGLLGAIVIATIAIYLPSLRNGWVFDDWQEIVNNQFIHSWSFVGNSFIHDIWWFRDPTKLPQSAYYRPLENAWFAVNALLFGTHPAAWHLAKIALHAVVVLLCFRAAQLLTGDVATALLTAAIFGVMPAHVEAVVWASAIPEPLSTAFELGALIFLIGRKPGWSRGLFIALLLYACAILTHESAILFPLIAGAYAYLIERKRACESIRLAAPFIAIAIGYMAARLYALGPEDYFGAPYNQALAALGWAKPAASHGAFELILTAPVVLLEYLGVLAMPGLAGPAHNVNWSAGVTPITLISVGAIAALAIIASAIAWRSPHRNLYMFCAAWSLLTIAPAMKLNALNALVQDRLLYAPSFGWSMAVAIAAVELAAVNPRARAAVAGATAMVLAAYAVSAVRIEHYWNDNLTFYARCVEIDPYNVDYLRLLVQLLNEKPDFAAAANVLERAVQLEPDNPYLHMKLANEYALMQRPADFRAEMMRTRALWGKSQAVPSP